MHTHTNWDQGLSTFASSSRIWAQLKKSKMWTTTCHPSPCQSWQPEPGPAKPQVGSLWTPGRAEAPPSVHACCQRVEAGHTGDGFSPAQRGISHAGVLRSWGSQLHEFWGSQSQQTVRRHQVWCGPGSKAEYRCVMPLDFTCSKSVFFLFFHTHTQITKKADFNRTTPKMHIFKAHPISQAMDWQANGNK